MALGLNPNQLEVFSDWKNLCLKKKEKTDFFLLGSTGCVDSETEINTPNGNIKIKNFNGGLIYSFNGKEIIPAFACPARSYKKEKLYKVTTESGREIICTKKHKFLTEKGWKRLNQLSFSEVVLLSEKNLQESCNHNHLPKKIIKEKIISIKYEKKDFYYDLHVPIYNNYLGNEFINHNSGKSFLPLVIFDRLCTDYNGIRPIIIRKSEAVLKRNLIPSYKKVLNIMGKQDEVKITDMIAKYPNGSEIVFVWADTSKDPDLLNIKGLEGTCVFLDEIDQLNKKVYTTIKTRIGRWNKNIYSWRADRFVDIPPFLFASCNPNITWVKTDIYDLHADNALPDYIYVRESYAQDNIDNLGQDYINMLKTLPEAERRRYLENRWDFADDPSQLIKYEWFKSCRSYELPYDIAGRGRKILAVDPTDEGTDKAVFLIMQAGTVIKIITKNGFSEEDCANFAENLIKEYDIAKGDIIVDAVGVGAGTANRLKKYDVYKFKGSSTDFATKDSFFEYKNIRAEAAWLLRNDFMNGEIEVLDHKELEQECLAVRYGTDGKTVQLEKKDKIKERIGRSPDHFDALCMANWLRRNLNSGKIILRVRSF